MNRLIQSRIDRPGNPKLRLGLWIVLVSLVAAVAWAANTELPRVVRAQVIIQPTGEVQRVQHPDGGRLAELLVSPGQRVEKGQLLLRIDRTRAASNLDENLARQRSLQGQIERLRAEASGLPYQSDSVNRADQVATHGARMRALEQQKQVLSERIQAVDAQQKSNASAIQASQDALASARTEYQQFKALQQSGAVSEVEVLRLQREVRERLASVQQLQAESPRLLAERQALTEEQATLLTNFRQQAQEELIQSEVELASLSSLADGISDRVKATEVLSPTTGLLGEVLVNTIGQVIQPGDLLMEIVPEQEQLAARVEVSPADIGFVSTGQNVNLRLSTYDFTRYGVLRGRVVRVGANTVEERDKEPFYPTRVELMAQFVGDRANLPVKVGMRGTADIITGSRTLLSYVLTPLSRVKYEAFTKR